MNGAPKHLAVPLTPRVTYKKNFIKIAVCELRFPTLLELETNEPVKLQGQLRKHYPHYEKQHEVLIGEKRYLFVSKDKNWTVVLKASSLALETTKYISFEDFIARFTEMLKIAGRFLDADFFTRVGLRYINEIPVADGTLEEWINPVLVGSFKENVLGPIAQSANEIRGFTDVGAYTFRHGVKLRDNPLEKPVDMYYLDFDYSSENVEQGELLGLLTKFNEINFSLFHWALGDKATGLLGPGEPKRRK